MYCSNCGKNIEEKKSNFCKHCGNQLKQENTSNEKSVEIKNILQDEVNVKSFNIKEFHYENEINSKIESDIIDKFSNIKKGLYSKVKLSEERFYIGYNIALMVLVVNLLSGFYYISSANGIASENGFSMVYSSIVYLIFIFLFNQFKMLKALCILIGIIFIDLIYSINNLNLFNGLTIVILLSLVISIIQVFRSSSDIKSNSSKSVQYIVLVSFFVYLLFSLYLFLNPDLFDKKWNEEITKDFEHNIYNSYNSLLASENTNDNLYVEKLSKYTAYCTIQEIKRQFPDFQDLLDGLKKNENEVTHKMKIIEQNCFKKAVLEIKK